jgi:serine/threonine protein kinase
MPGEEFMKSSSDKSTARPESMWEQTIRLPLAEEQDPRTSLSAGRPVADPELVRRVLERACRRVASARVEGEADYLLGELIGAGGMGEVYAATQVSLERAVAVKVLRQELLDDQMSRDSFFAEAFVTAELDHPNTPPVYEIGMTDAGLPFYAMKIVRGEKWSTTLTNTSIVQNVTILLMVCDVVAYAHGKGIIHRDLKPENVMIGPYGEVLLMDWGLSASLGNPKGQRLCEETLCAGTPAYMPPEVASCDLKSIGTASDIYLLGGILYEIVTGQSPHGGTHLLECIMAAMKNELQPTDKSSELLDIARQALHTDPGKRHGSVRAFATALRDALAHLDSFTYLDQGRRRLEALPGLGREELYHECHEIIQLYQRALAHWPGNVRAAEDLVRVRDILSTIALRRGEIQLARSQARALDQECQQYHLNVLAEDSVAEQIRVLLSERTRGGRQDVTSN